MNETPEQQKSEVTETEPIEGGAVLAENSNDLSPPIEGGRVEGVQDVVAFHERKHHAQTASYIGYILVGLLGVSFFFHYICKLFLVYNNMPDQAKDFSDDFKTWLPIISGLAGSATTYYFTRQNKL